MVKLIICITPPACRLKCCCNKYHNDIGFILSKSGQPGKGEGNAVEKDAHP